MTAKDLPVVSATALFSAAVEADYAWLAVIAAIVLAIVLAVVSAPVTVIPVIAVATRLLTRFIAML